MPEETQEEQKLTFGQETVGITFNPSKIPEVDRIKQQVANCIDQMQAYRKREGVTPEQARLASLSITALEEGCMWGVKSITCSR